MKTFEKNEIKITVDVNADGTVNLDKKGKMEFSVNGKSKVQEFYPSKGEGKNYGTVEDQFELAEASARFDETYENRIRPKER